MNDLDDILKHHGVKGMKWGVRRSRSQLSGGKNKPDAKKRTRSDIAKELSATRKLVGKKVRNKEMTRKQGIDAIRASRHKANMESSSTYRKSYNKGIRKGMSEKRATDKATKALNLSKSIHRGTFYASVVVGTSVVKTAHKLSKTPEAVRMGKNIILAAQKSPVRYPGIRDIKNVIN